MLKDKPKKSVFQCSHYIYLSSQKYYQRKADAGVIIPLLLLTLRQRKWFIRVIKLIF